MNKSRKSSPNCKNYNRNTIRRYKGQIVDFKGRFDRAIDSTTIILKNVSINKRQLNHITVILKSPKEFSKNQQVKGHALVKSYS